MDIADCYRVLGLRSGASLAEIKASYRDLARQYHPDINSKDPQAQDRFIKVTQAYKLLLSVVAAPETPKSLSQPRPPANQASSRQPKDARIFRRRATITRKEAAAEHNANLSESDQRLKYRSYQELQHLLKYQRFPRAIALMENLARRLPQDPEVRQWQAITYQRWGHHLIEQRQPDKARTYLKKALRVDPHNRSLWTEVERDFRRIEHLH